MQGRKLLLLPIIGLLTAHTAFGQNEMFKGVVNNLAFYREKKDLKYLSNAKKAVDSLITTHADSLDLQKSVYKALVNASILYADSLNKLNQPAVLFKQTTGLVNKLIGNKKVYRFQAEIDYASRCLANVYIRKAFGYIYKSDFVNALNLFRDAKKYAPSFQKLDAYIAYSNNKLGNLQASATYYNNLINNGDVKLEYIEAASSIYKSIGDTVTALQVIKKGRKLLPDEKSLTLDEANIYNNERDYKSLAPLLPSLLQTHEDSADVAFVAANCFDHLNDYNKAETLYLRSIEINSTSYGPVFNLGLLYFRENGLKGISDRTHNNLLAIQWLQKAKEISPNNVKCLSVLKLLYTETGNQDQLNSINNQLKQLTNQ
jgi:tetratricopeptide (TPR) repeat protein